MNSYPRSTLELLIITIITGSVAAQTHLTGRRLDGFSSAHQQNVNLFDQRGRASLRDVLEPGIHVDLPGQHGNQSPHPVVHRHSATVSHSSGTHVDLPGVHGNESSIPVVHRADTNAHADLPGQHGNRSPMPVVHRDNGMSFSDGFMSHPGAIGHSDINLPVSRVHGQDGVHVDLPGEHGNRSPHPVVHRDSGSHVDLPGQHGNISPHPAVHRQSGTHFDLPGQHGNSAPLSIVHRDVGDLHHHSQGAALHSRDTHVHSGFIDPITGAPVVLPSPRNDFDRVQHIHTNPSISDPRMLVDSRGDSRTAFQSDFRPLTNPELIQSPIIGPIGSPLMQRPGFVYPFEPGRFGPLPVFLPPEARRMRRMSRHMRRYMVGPLGVGGLPPPFPPPLPPPRLSRIWMRDLVAGAIGGLIGRLLRQ